MEFIQISNTSAPTSQEEAVVVTKILHMAIINNKGVNKIFLEILMEQGASLIATCPDLTAYHGYTALHIAAATNQAEVCQWLLEKGVPINIKIESGDTAMDKAAKRGHLQLIKFFREKGGYSQHADSCTQKLHELIDREDITEQDSVTNTLLNQLTELVMQGADVNGANKLNNAWQGDLPLHTLLVKGNHILITHLLALGANLYLPEQRRGETPLQRLQRVGDPRPIIHFLKENHAFDFEQPVNQIGSLSDATSNSQRIWSPSLFNKPPAKAEESPGSSAIPQNSSPGTSPIAPNRPT